MLTEIESITPYKKKREKSEETKELFGDLETLMQQSLKKRPLLTKIISSIRTKLEDIEIENYAKNVIKNNPNFKEFEKKLAQYLNNIPRNPAMKYLSILIILDELNSSFEHQNIELPDKVTALDVGAGKNWFYATALYNFLQNYSSKHPRTVKLDGVDALLTERDIRRFHREVENQEINLMQGNVLSMNHQGMYDFIFMHRMLTSPSHFRKFGLEPISIQDIILKCQDMLTPSGVQIMISPQSAGEYYRLVGYIPEERRLKELNYAVNMGDDTLNELFTPGLFRTYRDGICILKK
ncbi:MAG: hypothetical protein ACMXYG_02865 [Candidatus Woesearchaeota archaeon]